MEATQSVLVDDVAGEVRAWMARRQRSGANVARELDWTEVYLSRRLTGKVPFDVADLAALAELLEVPVDKFFQVDQGLRKGPFCARPGGWWLRAWWWLCRDLTGPLPDDEDYETGLELMA